MFPDCLTKTDDGVPENDVKDDDSEDSEASKEPTWPEKEEARRVLNEQMILQPVTPYQNGNGDNEVEEGPDEIQVDEALLHTYNFDIDTWEPNPDYTGLTPNLRATCQYAIRNIKIGIMVGKKKES